METRIGAIAVDVVVLVVFAHFERLGQLGASGLEVTKSQLITISGKLIEPSPGTDDRVCCSVPI